MTHPARVVYDRHMANLATPHKPSYPKAFFKLVKSYRSKIRRHVQAGTPFALDLVIGCSMDELFSYINSNLKPGMTWENYGTLWWFSNMESPREYDLTTSGQFLGYFNFRSFRPVLCSEMDTIGARSKGWPVLKSGETVTPN